MAWIRTIDESAADGELAELYGACVDPKTKRRLIQASEKRRRAQAAASKSRSDRD